MRKTFCSSSEIIYVACASAPSRVFNWSIAAADSSLVTADADTELGRMASEHPGIFFLTPPEDFALFRNALLCALSADGAKPGKNNVAREYAETFFSKKIVLQEFESMLLNSKPLSSMRSKVR